MNNTLFLPGFKPKGGRRRLTHSERLQKECEKLKKHEISHFRHLFRGLLPTDLFCKNSTGYNSRNRIFTFEVTFWAFLTQILWGNTSCREAVKAVQSWVNRAIDEDAVSSNTAAYCKARARLGYYKLQAIFQYVISKNMVPDDKLWHGRRVKMVDGTSFQLSDTAENQKEWPQHSNQKEGCGFPRVQLQGLICLATGMLLDWAETPINTSDSKAWKALWQFFMPGDVILADRAYGSYGAFSLLKNNGVDLVARLNAARKFSKKNGVRLSKNDWVITWYKPKTRPKGITKEEWGEIDSEIKVRITRYSIGNPGFRTQRVTLASSLLDYEKYSALDLAKLYEMRWGIEVRFRDIKTTMGMSALKGRTPYMVKMEIVMMAIGYNLVRALINRALKQYEEPLHYERVSVAGTLAQIRQHVHLFKNPDISHGQLNSLMSCFLRSLVDDPVPDRPGRSEPRAVKVRRRKYRILTKKRSEMVVESHKINYRKKA